MDEHGEAFLAWVSHDSRHNRELSDFEDAFNGEWSSLADYVTEKVKQEVPHLIGGGAEQTPHEVKNLVGGSPLLMP